MSKNITLPLYYTGLTTTALIQEQDGEQVPYTLARDYSVQVPISMPPKVYMPYTPYSSHGHRRSRGSWSHRRSRSERVSSPTNPMQS